MKTNTHKAIVFDFMRTLYDPETRALLPYAFDVLEYCSTSYDCYLVSYDEGDRDTLVKDLGIDIFFKKIFFLKRKTKKTFGKIIGNSYTVVYVIGDRVESEIQIGNRLGYTTIWLQKGKFQGRYPIHKNEHPDYCIQSLEPLLKIL